MLSAKSDSALATIFALASSRKGLLFLTILSGLIAQISAVACIAAGAWLVGNALVHATLDTLKPGFWILAIAVPVTAAARWWQAQVSHDFAFALIEDLQLRIYDGLERASPAYVLGQRTGDLASVATADAEMMENFYAHMLGDYISAILVPAAALIALAYLHWLLALTFLPFVLLLASVPLWLAGRTDAQSEKLATTLGQMNADITESIQGLRELSIFGNGTARLKLLKAQAQRVAAEQRNYGSWAGLQHAAMDNLYAWAVLAIAMVSTLLFSKGLLTLASLPLAIALTGGALLSVMDVSLTARKLGTLKAGAQRISTIMQQESQIEDNGRLPAPLDTTIEFKNVCFSYDANRNAALYNASFQIRHGETVALVGRSGAGKSTCTSLLLRFWDVNEGSILIGGQDVRQLPLAALRKMISIVPQEVFLFNESVANNIRLGKPQATQSEIEQAAALAQAHEFIQALPSGYETICGERGAQLSGGQRQRIAIARAFLCDAPILILDESTSSLDTESESALQIAMREIRRNRTVLVIAHRPSSIQAADRILVMKNGQIVEDGSHHQLLQRNTEYRDLISKQKEYE